MKYSVTMLKKSLLALLVAVAYIGSANAMTSVEVKRETKRAVSLMDLGRYGEARHSLNNLRKQISIDDEAMMHYVDFALARCASELRDNDLEQILLAFLRRYPESPNANEVRFMLAMYFCEREEFTRARSFLNVVDYKALSSDDKEKYNMRKGYIEFIAGNYDKANDHFSKLSLTGNYADHAVYYKSYIHYARGQYKEASKGFETLKNSDNYAKIIPYYLFQIKFAQGDYTYVVKHGDALMHQSIDVQRTELMRVIAESWYHLQNYNQACNYISIYQRSGGNMGREENYLLGYSAYRSANYSMAIDGLRKVAEGSDELAQNASYHLADCYIQIDDKKNAIHAFAQAANAKYNKEISEDALFNYGKLLFETGGGTFNESINILQRYVDMYPKSERVNEARELLIAAYNNSKDYERAYAAIKDFPNPDGEQLTALQRIVYSKGIAAYVHGDLDGAKAALKEAMDVDVSSKKYTALCYFWLGEIAYKQGDYKLAIDYYERYVKLAPPEAVEYKMSLYNMGYSHIALSDEAHLKKYFENAECTDIVYENNSVEADSLFCKAQDVYRKKYDEKYAKIWAEEAIPLLRRYLKSYPKGKYVNKALLYLSDCHLNVGRQKLKGFVWLHKEADGYRADAFNRLGDTYYTQQNYSEAIKHFKSAIALNTEHRFYARYYQALALGLSGKTYDKIKTLKAMTNEECGEYNDDAAYELGHTYVLLGKYDAGATALESFVNKYPQSPFYTPALLNLGLVHFNLGNSDKSLLYYDKVITAAPRSTAAKDAIQSVREIYVAKGKIKEYFEYAERTGVVYDNSLMARDSLSFRSAQNIYLDNRVADAIPRLESYLKDYPKGYYINDALLYLSDCYLRENKLTEAVKSLKSLAEQPKNQYTLSVVDKLATLTFENKMYGDAAAAYRQLSEIADTDAARSSAINNYAESVLLLNDEAATLALATEVETLTGIDASVVRRVQFAQAKIFDKRGKTKEACAIYKKLALDVTNAEGAESAYRLIEELYKNGEYEESEKRIYDFADSKTPHAYWLGKAFILLGDIYVQRKDVFQARATYRSVVDGYTPANDGIVAEAQSKLNKLN